MPHFKPGKALREAVDFLRYYAVQARHDFTNDAHRPLGPVVCISPWNFPLAIFSGQVAAALAEIKGLPWGDRGELNGFAPTNDQAYDVVRNTAKALNLDLGTMK